MCASSVMSTLCDTIDLAHQVPLPMEFSRQEYWRGCYFLLQRIFPIHGSNSCLLHLLHWQVGSLPLSHLGSPRESIEIIGNSHHLQGWKQREKVRPLGFRSLERVFCEAGIQSMQLIWCCFPRQVTRRLVLGVRKRLETGTICSGHSQLLQRQQ